MVEFGVGVEAVGLVSGSELWLELELELEVDARLEEDDEWFNNESSIFKKAFLGGLGVFESGFGVVEVIVEFGALILGASGKATIFAGLDVSRPAMLGLKKWTFSWAKMFSAPQ